ncbi:MAG: acyl-CoA dehydrogenase family protein [Spirochaetota bacterium]|nr:acyl-CoA dehydrogenase family protein [Spirochaetota bacterium]
MIDFEIAPLTKEIIKMERDFAQKEIRPHDRYYDEYEHEHDDVKEEIIEKIRQNAAVIQAKMQSGEKPAEGGGITMAMMSEARAWGSAYIGREASRMGLGNAAINAVATPEQRERFGNMFAAMAITEPGCGSDSAAITTTAKLDTETNEWIINGEKIFVTSGHHCDAVVVWATLDRNQGRPAIKSFVVEKFRKGMNIVKREKKLGIRVSDTMAIVFEDCRIPYDNILGSPEIKQKGGFKGVMKTFDMTRPVVGAMALGVAQAALEFTEEKLREEGFTFPYDRNLYELNAVQKTVLDMEANLEAARLLVWKSAAMLDKGERNSLEASCAKAKAGRSATLVTQKCVELLGPLGYSREWLVEKWMRDSKITDLFEGTGQIQMLVIARNILGFSRNQLK